MGRRGRVREGYLPVSAKPESKLVRACLDYLRLVGVAAWRNQSGMVFAEHQGKRRAIRMGAKGGADIIGCLPPNGRTLAVECKVPPNKLTPEQDAFLAAIRRAGGLAIVAESIDDVMEAINDRR